METLRIVGGAVTVLGSLFLLLAAIGLLRMPDVYNRMQAGTKATTFGTFTFLLGIGLAHPGWLPKIAVLIVFIVLTNPISSNVLARAAHYVGVPLAKGAVTDKLAEHEGRKQ